MGWAGHVARMAVQKCVKIVIENPEMKIPLGRPRCNFKIYIKKI
jgi:hypothetical protein